jgi:hypothetical protein
MHRLIDANDSSGRGGRGGISGNASIPDGKHGRDGTPNPDIAQVEIKVLGLDGRSSDVDVDQVLAFPDQCQMLIEKADSYFFTNNADRYKDAAIYYNRLAKRLAFIGKIDSDAEQQALLKSRLGKAYMYMQDIYGLTSTPMTQLQTIYNRASMNLSRLVSGKDMFGSIGNFAPRMSYDFYKASVMDSIKVLTVFEETATKFFGAMKDQSKFKAAIDGAAATNETASKAAEYQIETLKSPTGFLQNNLVVIFDKTPLLKEARKSLAKKVEDVEWTLKNNISLSPEKTLEMLASIAMAPHEFNTAVQVVSSLNKGWTTIEDNQGYDIKKEYVVSQFESCGDTLQSLEEAHRTENDGEIEIDDPGAMKVIATADSITKLLQQFKNSIPKEQSEALSKELDSYVKLIDERNTAVLNYNSGLQQLVELIKSKKIYDRQAKEIGGSMLALDPELPAVYFWLKRIRSGRRLETMRLLNYAGRAVAFWGPSDFSSFSFNSPGPLRDSVALLNQHQSLLSSFNDSIELIQDSVWYEWPEDDRQQGQGIMVQLSEDDLGTLKTAQIDENGHTFYEVMVEVRPESTPSFNRITNIRLSQVRVWLLGAQVDAGTSGKIMTVNIQHMGEESIWSSITKKEIAFSHVPIHLMFRYWMTADITDVSQCNGKIAFGHQDMKSYFGGRVDESSVAPIGPFAKWKITVSKEQNPGLQMELKEAYIEFCGRGLPV